MYKAKEFYELAGVKRSTVRHYREEGLLKPEKIDDNGYAYYSDKDLIDIMLMKNYRCLDYQVKDITSLASSPLSNQIQDLKNTKLHYEEIKEYLEKKIKAINNYTNVLEKCCNVGQIMYDPIGKKLDSFTISEVLEKYPREAKEEISNCIQSFPFIHIAGKGSIESFLNKENIQMQVGYENSHDCNYYQPIHSFLYHSKEAKPCVLIRLKVKNPLMIESEDLKPLYQYLEENQLEAYDSVYSCISCVEKIENETYYYVSVRVHVKSKK